VEGLNGILSVSSIAQVDKGPCEVGHDLRPTPVTQRQLTRLKFLFNTCIGFISGSEAEGLLKEAGAIRDGAELVLISFGCGSGSGVQVLFVKGSSRCSSKHIEDRDRKISGGGQSNKSSQLENERRLGFTSSVGLVEQEVKAPSKETDGLGDFAALL